MPKDSALAGRVAPEAVEWATTEELLAIVAELIDHNTRQLVAVNGGKPAPPIRLPRPSSIARPRRPATSEDLRRLFGGDVHFTSTD